MPMMRMVGGDVDVCDNDDVDAYVQVEAMVDMRDLVDGWDFAAFPWSDS